MSKITLNLDYEPSRVGYDEAENRYHWEGNECLGVFVASEAPTPNTYADVALKDGRGYCTVTTKGYKAGDKMYVYYPFSDMNDGFGADNLRLTIPSHQSIEAGVFSAAAMPMVALPITLSSSTESVYMRPLAGILTLRIYASSEYVGEQVRAISYSSADEAMSGTFRVDATAEGESIGLHGGDAKFVTASLATPYSVGSTKESAKGLYIIVATGNYSGTLSVTTNKAIYTYEYNRSVARNRYYNVNIDLSKATNRQPLSGDFGGGDGTAEKPYIIASTADLVRLSTLCSTADNSYADKHYRQICDIDLAGSAFTPIGSEATPFAGCYDGGNFVVSGISIASSKTTPAGMFGSTNGATISGVVIRDFTNNGTGERLGGVVGYAQNTTIEGCTMDSDIFTSVTFSGGIAGYISNTKITNCTMTSTVKSITAEWAQSGGIAGYADATSVVEKCTVTGSVASMNHRVGGIVGELRGGKIVDCRFSKISEAFTNGHSIGGIVGGMYGGEVSNCTVEGIVGSKDDYCGGVVGNFAEGKVLDCTVQGCAEVSSYNDYCGGIAGAMYTTGAAIIDGCTVYCDVTTNNIVGGIVGYIRPNTSGGKIVVANSIYVGGEVYALGFNSNRYNLAGGITGWIHGNYEKVTFANVVALPKCVRGQSMWNGKVSAGGIAGITGFRNGSTKCQISNCYTNITDGTILLGGAPVSAHSSDNYGALYGRITEEITLTHFYYDESIQIGADNGLSNLKKTNCQALSSAKMTDGTLLAQLNAAVQATPTIEGITMRQWVADANGYPVISTAPANVSPATAQPKRVSVIGDSISTFRGYIPYGYGAHYPTTDGDLNLVGQTYWYRLIYDFMQNARLERNISYSGTCVTNSSTTADSYYAKRFIDQQGVGDADIVIIHGGTNDCAKNIGQLVDGLSMKSHTPPSDSVVEALCQTADKATTRAEIEALDDTTFCEAYIKLIKLIRERRADTKIVCVIGDYLNGGIQQSIHKIAKHYDAKVVDLLAVNGFNDQTYMPKHDYNPSTGKGCHPSSKGMEFIARKIYTELGAWLEE